MKQLIVHTHKGTQAVCVQLLVWKRCSAVQRHGAKACYEVVKFRLQQTTNGIDRKAHVDSVGTGSLKPECCIIFGQRKSLGEKSHVLWLHHM